MCRDEGIHKAKETKGKGPGSGPGLHRELYLLEELIHKVVSIHMDHLLFIITVFRLEAKQGQIHEQSLPCSPRLTLPFWSSTYHTHIWVVPVLVSEKGSWEGT